MTLRTPSDDPPPFPDPEGETAHHGSGGPDSGGPTPEGSLTHLDREGHPRMVDVSGKAESTRTAVAVGSLSMRPETLHAIQESRTSKGDVIQVAELAGLMGGKRTGELIPLCHLLPGVSLTVTLEPDPDLPGIRARAVASYRGSTGVEMEALTAVSLALLTVYDMAKSMDRGMRIDGVQLVRKEGGRSGTWVRNPTVSPPRPPQGSGPDLPAV